MKELYTKPVSEVNEFSQTADTLIKAFGDGRNAVSFCVLKTLNKKIN